MTTSRRFLFTLPDAGGNAAPQLSVARAMVERGHDVRVLADPVLGPEVEAVGAEHVTWSQAPHRVDRHPDNDLIRDWEAKSPAGGFTRMRDRIMCGPAAAFAADTLAELERRPADVVVTDLLIIGPQIAAEATGTPVVLLMTTVFSVQGWGSPPLGPGFAPARGRLGRLRDRAAHAMAARMWKKGLPTINAARAEYGLPPLEHLLDAFTKPRMLILTSPSLEFETFSPPSHVTLTGPRLDDPQWSEPWTPPAGDDPLVLVGLTSTFQDQAPALNRIAQALGRLPVRGVLTTGPSLDPSAVAGPSNVTVLRSAPHSQVLEHAAAAVTHCGHGVALKALAAGVPQVCMPFGRDQHDVAARVQHAGAGVRIKASASAADIAAALRRVLDEPSFAAGAQRMAANIADEIREDRAAMALEEMAGVDPRVPVAAM